MFLGDFPEDFTTVTCMFTTHAATGAPVAPSSAFEAADVIIYKNGSGTQKTTANGVTMTSPFDSITGLHCVVIDTSNDTGDAGFWTAGAQYTLVLSPDETVDSVAVAKVLGTFGIELAEVLRPTTAGRQLDVSAGGEAGIDWANIGSPTTAVNLSATNIDVDQVVASVTGNVTGSIGSVAAGGITASSIAADAIGASELAADAATEIATAVWALATRTLTSGANIDGSTFTAIPWAAAWDAEVQSEVTDALNAYDPPTKAELDAAVAPLATSAALATVDGIVDDILVDTGTTLPGTLSTLATAANLATVAGYIDTEIATIITNIAALNDLSAADVAGEIAGAGLATAAALATVDGNVDTLLTRLSEMWALDGLDGANPMTVTPTARSTGTLSQTISGDGTTTTTVTRDP